MLYRYNKHLVGFVRVTWPYKLIVGVGVIALSSTIFSLTTSINKRIIEKQVILVMSKQNAFTQEKLIKKIKEMNFQFPYIVYGQAMLESSHFKSPVFLENNNLFGMKESTFRISTAVGVQNGHAYYSTWIDSIYDYGYYQATYLSKLKTEDEYFDYLSQYYATDSTYVVKLKNIIKGMNLKLLFN